MEKKTCNTCNRLRASQCQYCENYNNWMPHIIGEHIENLQRRMAKKISENKSFGH